MSSRIALAEIYLKAGEDAQALNAIDSALRAGERTGARAWLAGALHIKGKVLASMAPARWPDAETCFKEALQVARFSRRNHLSCEPPPDSPGYAASWEGGRTHTKSSLRSTTGSPKALIRQT